MATKKVKMETEIRHEDTIFPKLFTIGLKGVSNTLDGEKNGIGVVGKIIYHLVVAVYWLYPQKKSREYRNNYARYLQK